MEERKWRLTASKFGEICHLTEARDLEKFCKTLLNPDPLNTAAIVHGRTYEQKAIEILEERLQEKVEPSGLFVRPDLAFLGATPDGLIGSNAIVECKCPYSGRQAKIVPGKFFPFLEKDGNNIKLKRGHPYFYQIMGQLGITKREKCFFCVYTHKDFFVQEVSFDQSFFSKMIDNLRSFYFAHYEPFILKSL